VLAVLCHDGDLPPKVRDKDVQVCPDAYRHPGFDDCCASIGSTGNDGYTDKNQLVAKKAVSEATYEKIKDHVVAKHPKS
jgi:hypothetical protein